MPPSHPTLALPPLNLLAFAGALLVASIATTPVAQAERYLTVEQAQKTCFNAAARFERVPLNPTPEQLATIAKTAGLPPRKDPPLCWRAFGSDGTQLGTILVDRVPGKHEWIDFAVAIGNDGRVLQVEILEYRESHGSEVRGEKWRTQFRGKNLASPVRLRQDVFNVSGATISCKNVTDGVRRALVVHDLLLRPSQPGLPTPPSTSKTP